jgi:DNA-binding IclR family transcriptional regulator
MAKPIAPAPRKPAANQADVLMVRSVEKAFRVLEAFDPQHATMSLSQVAAVAGLDKSAAQRFTHTLERLGYLRKDPESRHFELTTRTLKLGHNFTRASALIERAVPYLMHLSKETDETINLTVRDDTEIVFVLRFLSRQVLNPDVTIGTRMPAYCTAPGIAMLAHLRPDEARAILKRSDLRPYTASTTWQVDRLMDKLALSAERGYATAYEEFYHGDLSIAAAALTARQEPACAVNIAVSRARYTPEEAERRFAAHVVAAARSISQGLPRGRSGGG